MFHMLKQHLGGQTTSNMFPTFRPFENNMWNKNLGHARLAPPTGHVLLRIRSKSIIFTLLPATSPWEIGLECLVKRFCIEFWPNSSLFVPARGVQTNVFLKTRETASTYQHLGPISEINISTCGQHLIGGRSPTSNIHI